MLLSPNVLLMVQNNTFNLYDEGILLMYDTTNLTEISSEITPTISIIGNQFSLKRINGVPVGEPFTVLLIGNTPYTNFIYLFQDNYVTGLSTSYFISFFNF